MEGRIEHDMKISRSKQSDPPKSSLSEQTLIIFVIFFLRKDGKANHELSFWFKTKDEKWGKTSSSVEDDSVRLPLGYKS